MTEYAASAGAHSSSQIPKGAVSLPQGMVRRMSILHLWWQRNQRALSGTDSSTGGEVVVTEYAASAGAHSSSQRSCSIAPRHGAAHERTSFLAAEGSESLQCYRLLNRRRSCDNRACCKRRCPQQWPTFQRSCSVAPRLGLLPSTTLSTGPCSRKASRASLLYLLTSHVALKLANDLVVTILLVIGTEPSSERI